MKLIRTERSQLDPSTNFVLQAEDGAIFEARMVWRDPGDLIVYVSSQGGCRQACRMCHLTQTGQTRDRDATVGELRHQISVVMEHASHAESFPGHARRIHLNFMSRGEPLASERLFEGPEASFARQQYDSVNPWKQVRFILQENVRLFLARTPEEVPQRVKISTIFPQVFFERFGPEPDLHRLLGYEDVDLYYSLYSTDEAWRKRWFPKAAPVEQAFRALKRWSDATNKIPYIHLAVIPGENDGEEAIEGVADALANAGLFVNLNLVQYNPPEGEPGKWPRASTIEDLEKWAHHAGGSFAGGYLNRIQCVGRVGQDVHASCGMFVAGASK